MNTAPPEVTAHEREPTDTTLEVDFDYYQRYLEDLDLTDEQKNELISTIATIILAWIDLGFGVSTTQVSCEEDDWFDQSFPFTIEELLEWNAEPNTTNNDHFADIIEAEGSAP